MVDTMHEGQIRQLHTSFQLLDGAYHAAGAPWSENQRTRLIACAWRGRRDGLVTPRVAPGYVRVKLAMRR